ncbi:MAG: hypothetical protein AB1760_17940 [Pseudomonadota bacterium]
MKRIFREKVGPLMTAVVFALSMAVLATSCGEEEIVPTQTEPGVTRTAKTGTTAKTSKTSRTSTTDDAEDSLDYDRED